MPIGIAAPDRKLLLIGGALLLIMLTASVVLAPPGDQKNSRVPSTYSTQSAGAQAAYLLLLQLHYPVRRWEDPPTELPEKADSVLLILAEPQQPSSTKERKALMDFVRGGGHVLFTGSRIPTFFQDAHVSVGQPDFAWKSFAPTIPSRIARGAPRVTLEPQALWGRLSELQIPLYGEPESPVVILWRLGNGQILWWAGSTPLTNAGISRDQNLVFFLNSVANWSADRPYQIYWDEYFHGQRTSLWSYFGKTSLLWGLLQIGALGAAVLFTYSRRSGPIYLPADSTRLSPLEFVDTLGGLYERAGAASSAVAISYVRLRSLLLRQLSLPSNASDAELSLAAEQRLGWANQELGDLLRRAQNATDLPKLRPREALDMVQKLERQAANLSVHAKFPKEST